MKGHKLACKRWLFSLQKATFYKLKDGLLHIGLVWVHFVRFLAAMRSVLQACIYGLMSRCE